MGSKEAGVSPAGWRRGDKKFLVRDLVTRGIDNIRWRKKPSPQNKTPNVRMKEILDLERRKKKAIPPQTEKELGGAVAQFPTFKKKKKKKC